jgi:hypothetical protein
LEINVSILGETREYEKLRIEKEENLKNREEKGKNRKTESNRVKYLQKREKCEQNT